MDVWRLCSERHVALSGEGAHRVGGCWNSPGRAVVYASESLALCLAEALVHVTGALPLDYVAVSIAVPDASCERLDAAALESGWRDELGSTRAIGDQCLVQVRSLALLVPSAVVPASTNVLLNPAHAAAVELEILEQKPFRFDPRLRAPPPIPRADRRPP